MIICIYDSLFAYKCTTRVEIVGIREVYPREVEGWVWWVNLHWSKELAQATAEAKSKSETSYGLYLIIWQPLNIENEFKFAEIVTRYNQKQISCTQRLNRSYGCLFIYVVCLLMNDVKIFSFTVETIVFIQV